MQSTNTDADTLLEIARINEAIASKTLSKADLKDVTALKEALEQQLKTKGFSDATKEPLETAVTREMDLDQVEMDEAAILVLWKLTHGLLDITLLSHLVWQNPEQ